MSRGLDRASKNLLNRRTAARFAGDTLFDRIARAVCEAECLPRKELYEAWEVARRVRRRMRGGPIYDLAAGHGLVAALLLVLDDTSPHATCVDTRDLGSRRRLLDALEQRWPRLAGRVHWVEGALQQVSPPPEALVVSVHACGSLTDQVLDVALAARCRVAVLPCCHDAERCDPGPLAGWMDTDLAIDVLRAQRLRAAGYRVVTQRIPGDITPKNRLLLGWPEA